MSRVMIRAAMAILAASASPLLGQNAKPAPAASPVAAPDATGTAPGGATFLMPAGWTARTAGKVLTLSPPENDLHLAIVDAGVAPDAKVAAATAWELYRPHAAHPFKLLTARPPRNGWEEQAVVDYETSPSEHLEAQAIARRKGSRWVVLILDGSQSTEEKREAALGQVIASLRPAGYTRETFAGQAAHPLDPARVAMLVDFVRRNAIQLRVPGVGFALYSGGQVVYEGGVGVRELGTPEPVAG